MQRRQFIKSTFMGGGAAIAWPHLARGEKKLEKTAFLKGANKSRVVIAGRSDVRDRSGAVSAVAVERMLDTAIEHLFAARADHVWSTLFSPHDRVGLKVNCLAGRHLSTHQELVFAVVERLLWAGVPQKNIIIWDRRDRDLVRAGYKIEKRAGRVRCLGNDSAGFTPTVFEFNTAASQLSNTIHSTCTAIINLPIMKDHGIAGVSGSMKNFFGAINNPNKYHMDVGDPYIADVNMLPAIRKKHRLTICDALTAQYEGGPPWMPQWAWNFDRLVVATDRVAIDQIIWETIENKRAQAGLPTLEAVGRKPTYIATAADSMHRLGTNDPEKIDIVRA